MYLYLKKLESTMIFTVSIYPYIIFIVKSLPNKTLRRKLVGRKTRIYRDFLMGSADVWYLRTR